MPLGDGKGRLGRGKNCDEVAQSDRMGQGKGLRPLRERGQGRGLGPPAGGRGLGRRRKQVL